MTDRLWQLEDVTVAAAAAPRGKAAGPRRLDAITLTIEPGVTAIIGNSGAGKTTLLNLLVGFEKPQAGRITRHLPQPNGRLPLFWAPDKFGLWPHLNVRQHLHAVAPKSQSRENHIDALLARFDLDDLATALPERLSQGERSRLAVARALAAQPAVLVMDEPLAHVDPARVGKFWDAIREAVGDAQPAAETEGGAACRSLVFTTHEPETVLAQAQRVVCLKDGRVLYAGDVDELYWRPASRELAQCLGEANWFEAGAAAVWLSDIGRPPSPSQGEGWGEGRAPEHPRPGDQLSSDAQISSSAPQSQPLPPGTEELGVPRCVRPEQLAIEPSDPSDIVVQHASFAGSVARAELKHEPSGTLRTFLHRPAVHRLRTGMRVAIRLLTLVTLVALIGCNGGTDPTLHVEAINYWPVPADGPRIPAPRSVCIGPNDEVVVLDDGGRVLIFDASGKLISQWRMPSNKDGNPEGACWLKDGRIVVADTHYHRLVFFDPGSEPAGKIVATLGEQREGDETGRFNFPVGVVQDDNENIYVSEYGGGDRVQKFTRDGQFMLTFGGEGTGPGQFQRAGGMVWREGKVYVSDATNGRVQVFNEDGMFISVIGEGQAYQLQFPYDMDIGSDGAMYVIEWGAGRVTQLSLTGELLGRFGNPGMGEGQFRTPWSIAVDSQMRLRVADTANRRIVELRL